MFVGRYIIAATNGGFFDNDIIVISHKFDRVEKLFDACTKNDCSRLQKILNDNGYTRAWNRFWIPVKNVTKSKSKPEDINKVVIMVIKIIIKTISKFNS